MDVDIAFLKSKRGILKVAEMVRQFAPHQKFEHFSVCNRGTVTAKMCWQWPVHKL